MKSGKETKDKLYVHNPAIKQNFLYQAFHHQTTPNEIYLLIKPISR